MKRKLMKVLVIFLAVVVVFGLLLALTIGPIAKWYIEGHSKELIGRKILVGSLHINLFTGVVEVDSLRMFETDDNQVFASVDTFSLRLALPGLFKHKVEISDMRIIHPAVVIVQNNKKFNFDDISARFANDTAKSSLQWVVLKNILLRDGSIGYRDLHFGRDVTTAIGSITTDRDTLYMQESRYMFDEIHCSNIILGVAMKPVAQKDTLTHHAAQEQPPAKPPAAQAMALRIHKFQIDNSQCIYTDSTLVSPLRLPVSAINIQANNFDLNGENEVSAKAEFPEGGKLDFRWKGSMTDLSNQQIMMNLQNLSLRLFSPYCLQYTAYDITDGNLNFVSKNIIKQYNIESTNQLDSYKMDVGDKHGDLKPEYNLPLGLALYLLKDKDDKISFDVPVKGNLKDPQFSYSGIILKTLLNLMVKVALSPFRFLARSLGFNASKMESIPIEPLQTNFTAEQYRQIGDLASIYRKKPDMTMTLTQFVNMKDEVPAYALYKTKAAYLAIQYQGQDRGPVGYDDVSQLDDHDQNFEAYLDTLVLTRGMSPEGKSQRQKLDSLYTPDSLQVELDGKMAKRNDLLRTYMMKTFKIPAKKLIVKTADKPLLDKYTDKPIYKIEMAMPGTSDTTKGGGGKQP